MLETIIQTVAGLLVLGGAFFSLVAALGVLRLQDALIRMHASSKAGTLGCGMVLLAVAVLFRDVDIVARALAAIAFIVITAPVAAHMIGRAAYAAGVPLWEGTVADEMRGRFVPADGQPADGRGTPTPPGSTGASVPGGE